MPITDTRLKTGTLTLDALPFATQATNVRLVPKTDEEGDPLETLSGDTVEADDVTTWSLIVVAVQDFEDVAGFVNFSMVNAGELVPYSWKANPTAPTYSGTARVRPVEIGGDVNKRNTTTATWPLTAKPLRTEHAA